jgi:hypothetical protein
MQPTPLPAGYGHKGKWKGRELELMPTFKGHLAEAIPETRKLTAAERRLVCAREGLARLQDVALPASAVRPYSEWDSDMDDDSGV